MNPTVFRWILVIYFVLSIFCGLLDRFFPSHLPPELYQWKIQHYLELTTFSKLLLLTLTIFSLVTTLAAFIGLYFFKYWAPSLAIISTIVGSFLYSIYSEVRIVSVWQDFFSGYLAVLWGVIIALIYFSPLKEKFKTKPISDSGFSIKDVGQ